MDETVRDAVFGNVGTMISMRVSAEDAPLLAKQFEPQFEPNDLLNMSNRHLIVNMVIAGEKTQPFSATTLALPTSDINHIDEIIANSRAHYARPRDEVETEIAKSMMPSADMLPKGAPNPADPRVQVANSVGIDPKIMLKTSPNGTTGSQKLVIPSGDGINPRAEITVAPTPKHKRTRSRNNNQKSEKQSRTGQ
ncbi:hypothetical protein FACS189431_8930 [Alphaproteobacteria bacterium]|nr:hypothetical protein FACS189431_8930 [Alphaproteobacteria bacterium]